MPIESDLFAGFSGREESLRGIVRYHSYRPMFYRSNLYTHSWHVAWLVAEFSPVAMSVWGQAYDPVKAYTMALVHDDPEIIMGDIEAGDKSKMNSEQLAEVVRLEAEAIEKISAIYPQCVGEYSYRDLLRSISVIDSNEAYLVKFADKFDAFGEALHELFAGNVIFNRNNINQYGKIPTPVESYIPCLSNFGEKFPDLLPVLQHESFPLENFPWIDFEAVIRQGQPHTPATLPENTGYVPYDFWKKIMLQNMPPDMLSSLYYQAEFPTL